MMSRNLSRWMSRLPRMNCITQTLARQGVADNSGKSRHAGVTYPVRGDVTAVVTPDVTLRRSR